jgi:hypothetical protein
MAKMLITMERIDMAALNQYIMEGNRRNYPKLKIVRAGRLRKARL